MRHSKANVSQLEKCVRKICQLLKCVTVRKMCYTETKASRLDKFVTKGKISQSWRNVLH